MADDPKPKRGIVVDLRAKLTGKVAKDPVVQEVLQEEIGKAASPPLPAPPGLVEGTHRLSVEMLERARDAGIMPDDPMYALIQGIAIAQVDMASTVAVWERQVEHLVAQQEAGAKAAAVQNKAILQATASGLVGDLRDVVSVELGRLVSRVPLAIGRLRSALVAGMLVIALVLGYLGGFSHGRSAVRSMMAVDAGTNWTASWLRLRRWNDIDKALKTAQCVYAQNGHRHCQVVLDVGDPEASDP